MGERQQEISRSLFQRRRAFMNGAGQNPQPEIPRALLDPCQPTGHGGARQRAAGRQRYPVERAAGMPDAGANVIEPRRGASRRRQQRLAGGGQAQRHHGAVDQVRPGPQLQGADAARKLRLRDMAQFGRPGKAAFARQGDEIFKPFMVHIGTL